MPGGQKGLVMLSRAFENITKQLQQVDCKKLKVINYQMDLAAVDAIALRNIKKENIQFAMENVNTKQLTTNDSHPHLKSYPINYSAIITIGSVVTLSL